MSELKSSLTKEPKRKGRPPKTELNRKSQRKGVIGRPKGDATIINEYKARMLASPKSSKVLDAIFDAALDNEHKHQASAWKLLLDRVAPIAAFEKEVIKGNGKSSIQINITGVGSPVLTQEAQDQEDLEAEYTVV